MQHILRCRRTLAGRRLHAGNARWAASMASTVSERPISGTVPSCSLVAGSDERELSIEFKIATSSLANAH